MSTNEMHNILLLSWIVKIKDAILELQPIENWLDIDFFPC